MQKQQYGSLESLRRQLLPRCGSNTDNPGERMMITTKQIATERHASAVTDGLIHKYGHDHWVNAVSEALNGNYDEKTYLKIYSAIMADDACELGMLIIDYCRRYLEDVAGVEAAA